MLLTLSKVGLCQNKEVKDTIPTQHLEDFSNKKQIDLSLLLSDHGKSIESTIVVVNNKKIYRLDSKEFRALPKDNFFDVSIVKDEHSSSSIRNIIFITMKPSKDGQ